MFKITYNQNGEEVTKEFDSYRDLVLFVAENRIRDNEFVSLDFGDKHIGSIFELEDLVAERITAAKEAEAEEDDEDSEYAEEE